ncbi:hypothetical protein Q7P37_009121 [Cladosporium fusiforme]
MPPQTLTLNVTGVPQRLTTVFTRPTDCLHAKWTSGTSVLGMLVCTKGFTESCFPSSFKEAATLHLLYSPGVCPDGYTPGHTFSSPASSEVTSAVCCPTSMTFNVDAENCQTLITESTDVVVGNTTTQYAGPFSAIEQLVLVAWKDSDFSSFSPISAPLLQISAMTASKTSTPLNPSARPTGYPVPTQSDNSTTSTTSTNELTVSAKIGMGVGISCGVLLLCALVGLLVYRRHLRRMHEGADTGTPTAKPHVVGVDAKAELSGHSHVHEIDSRQVFTEVDGLNARHELEGDWHGVEARGT